MALNGAVSFKLYADLDKGQKKIFWDEHSLDEQRFYDTLCLATIPQSTPMVFVSVRYRTC